VTINWEGVATDSVKAWSDWLSFPDPRRCEVLTAPFGAGCYEIKRRDTGKLVLFGMSDHVAARMTSLLPKPYGTGTRNNLQKREYILAHLGELEYRTLACPTRRQAQECERKLKESKSKYEFQT
jgi:hypothetical protein